MPFAIAAPLSEEMLQGAGKPSGLKISPEELAQNVVFAMRGFEETAKDAEQMLRMIALHVDVTLAALRQH